MRINVITTMEIDKDESEYFTQDEIHKVYDEFREIIKNTFESNDLTDFSFINADTNNEIESEVDEE